MLNKLLKHEFRATGRVMLPLYLAMAVLGVFANISGRVLEHSGSAHNAQWFLQTISTLTLIAFGCGLIAIFVMTLVLMINRFYRNLMGSEGYLMMTLPTTTFRLIFSKALVAVVWFAATTLVSLLSCFIAAYRVGYLRQIVLTFSKYCSLSDISGADRANLVLIALEVLLVIVVFCAGSCLQIYASIAAGHSFNSHKGLLSFVFFFGFQFLLQLLLISLASSNLFSLTENFPRIEVLSDLHGPLLLVAACGLLYCAVFYFITSCLLQKKLNLQ